MKHGNSHNSQVNDSEEQDQDNEIAVVLHQKKRSKNYIKKKYSRCNKDNKDIMTSILPEYIKVKDEDWESIEFVLGDLHAKFTDLTKFTKMTSLSLINEGVKTLSSVIQHIPIKDNIKFLSWNQNEIENLDGIEQLANLEELYWNFNQISQIGKGWSGWMYLKKVWWCGNKIEIMDNWPDNICEVWLASNMIREVPRWISKYKDINFLNLSGNCWISFDDIYLLQSLSKWTQLYWSDINFGDNPWCQYINYRVIMLYMLPQWVNLDQLLITAHEKKDVENWCNKKQVFYKNKMRHSHKITKMICQLMKSNKIFMQEIKYYQACFFSQRKKMLEYALYEKEFLGSNSETKCEDIKREIAVSQDKFDICVKTVDTLARNYSNIKASITEINDFNILSNFYEMETHGNLKWEFGSMNCKWTKSCIELIKSRMSSEFFQRENIKGISVSKVMKIVNKKSKILFDSLYDNWIDEIDKFGDEKKYFDFYFLFIPEEHNNLKSILPFIFEDNLGNITGDKGGIQMIVYDSPNAWDGLKIKHNKKEIFYAVICKSAIFDHIKEELKPSDLLQLELSDYDSFSRVFENKQTDKHVITWKKESTNFIYYKLNGLSIPEYIVEYEYTYNNCNETEGNGLVSSFTNIHKELINDYDNIFNKCAKELFESQSYLVFLDQDTVNKHSLIKFSEFEELNNPMFYFGKESVYNFWTQCFKYKREEEFKCDIIKIKEKLTEIVELKFQKSFKELFLNLDRDALDALKNIKSINWFNCNLDDKGVLEFFRTIKACEEKEVKHFRENWEEIILAKNNIQSIDLLSILSVFPNIMTIDLSHNQWMGVTYSNIIRPDLAELGEEGSEIKEKENKISILDLSFNSIVDFNIVVELYEKLKGLTRFIYFANPFRKHFLHFDEDISNTDAKPEKRDMIIKEILKFKSDNTLNTQIIESSDKPWEIKQNSTSKFQWIYDCFSFTTKYSTFNNSKYFLEMAHKETNLKSVNLTKKKLVKVPPLDSVCDIQILYLNWNKISKMTNWNTLVNWTEWYIQNNKITKLENLPPNLISLDISNNELQTWEGVSIWLHLQWLSVENNVIKNISEVITLSQLREFYCAGNFVDSEKDCTQLRDLLTWQILDLSSNDICRNWSNFRALMIYRCPQVKVWNRLPVRDEEKWKAVEFFTGKWTNEVLEKKLGVGFDTKGWIELDLSNMKLKDDIGLFTREEYPKLWKWNISRNLFKTFNIFGQLPAWSEWYLNYNLFTEILPKKDVKTVRLFNDIYKAWTGLVNLETLEMSGNALSNWNGISLLSNLQILVLRENNVSKIDPINKMNHLTFLDWSFNKIRVADKTTIGYWPSLQICLFDNNYWKNINGFVKCPRLQTLSFENNKLIDYFSWHRLAELEQWKDLNLLNNGITKTLNYRKTMLEMFEGLIKLDGSDVLTEERDMIALERQMGDNMDNSQDFYQNNIPQFLGKNTSANYNYNLQKWQDKNWKKVNCVTIDLLSPGLIPLNYFNLPHIKPQSSEAKRGWKGALPMNNMSSNNINNNMNGIFKKNPLQMKKQHMISVNNLWNKPGTTIGNSGNVIDGLIGKPIIFPKKK